MRRYAHLTPEEEFFAWRHDYPVIPYDLVEDTREVSMDIIEKMIDEGKLEVYGKWPYGKCVKVKQ